MAVTAPLPAAVRALQANLRRAREPALRERLSVALAGVKRLYGLDSGPQHEETGDLRRRRLGLRPSQQRPALNKRKWNVTVDSESKRR
jgi:hypothetical protein